jgi:hypothetical protein
MRHINAEMSIDIRSKKTARIAVRAVLMPDVGGGTDVVPVVTEFHRE